MLARFNGSIIGDTEETEACTLHHHNSTSVLQAQTGTKTWLWFLSKSQMDMARLTR
jgi:hypothetical protein